MTLRRVLVAALLSGMVSGLPMTTAFAADSGDDTQSASAGQSASDFSDKQLEQFVASQNNVQAALRKYDGQIADAEGDEKEELQTEENKALVEAVKSSGLDPETYNAIAKAAQDNPELTQRIQSFMTPQ